MKLFSICTPQSATLKNEWFLKTLQDDWELYIVDLDNVPRRETAITCPGSGTTA